MLDVEYKTDVCKAGKKGPTFFPDELCGGRLRICLSHSVIPVFLPYEHFEHAKDAAYLGKDLSLFSRVT